MTAEEYRALLDTDFSDVDIEDLTDVRKIKIDKNLPQEKRQAQYLKQVGNPYLSVLEAKKFLGELSVTKRQYDD